MSSGFEPRSSPVLTRSIEVQRLVIPFIIDSNIVPASKVIGSDEPSVLLLLTQGESQLPTDPNPPPFPPTTNPASPVLATSATYGVLAASALTNSVGTSVINGDLGLYPGTSVTGAFTVTGSTNVNNAAAHQAQTDATAAYTNLSTRSSTVIPSALDGQVLTAGAYSFASGAATLATSAPGTLTFNGSATDVFIIITASTLTTGAGGAATIALTGGALASNVYWAIGSSATLNSGTAGTFVGTLIAQASVTNSQGGTVNGRLMALSGAITFSEPTTVNRPVPVTPADSRFDLAANDSTGAFNFMVELAPGEDPLSNGDRAIRIMSASVIDRISGVSYPCYPNSVKPAISVIGDRMYFNCSSGLNFATTTMNACFAVEYIVHE